MSKFDLNRALEIAGMKTLPTTAPKKALKESKNTRCDKRVKTESDPASNACPECEGEEERMENCGTCRGDGKIFEDEEDNVLDEAEPYGVDELVELIMAQDEEADEDEVRARVEATLSDDDSDDDEEDEEDEDDELELKEEVEAVEGICTFTFSLNDHDSEHPLDVVLDGMDQAEIKSELSATLDKAIDEFFKNWTNYEIGASIKEITSFERIGDGKNS